MGAAVRRNVPELRFGGFEGEWLFEKIGKLADVGTGNKDTQNKIDNGAYPFFVRSNNVERINSFSFDGEAVLTSGDGVGVGKNFHYINGKFDFHQRVYCISAFSEGLHGKYFYSYFSESFYRRVIRLSAKNSVDSVRMSMITEMLVPLPALPEQQKIAAFLGAVNDKLTALRRKRELLQEYKRGMMQKIFSRELRFKGDDGVDFPDWEETTLGKASRFFDSSRVPLSQDERKKLKGVYPYYGASGIIDYVNDYLFEGEYILLAEDGANIVMRNSPIAFLASGRFWVNNHAHILQAKGSNKFLAEYLESLRYEKYNTGTAQPKLNAEVCKKIMLILPSVDEQQKIADFLSAIDSKIESVAGQIAQVETFKKGLLQKMFV